MKRRAAVEERDRAHICRDIRPDRDFIPGSGRGAKIVDADGTAYWDLFAGIAVNALGHRHPRSSRTLREEAGNVWHVSNLLLPPGARPSRRTARARLGALAPFFCNSGTEANEAALKFARLKNPGRPEVVALEEGFHGRTFGALSVTGHAAYRQPVRAARAGRALRPAQRRRRA